MAYHSYGHERADGERRCGCGGQRVSQDRSLMAEVAHTLSESIDTLDELLAISDYVLLHVPTDPSADLV